MDPTQQKPVMAAAKWFADHYDRPWSEVAVSARLPLSDGGITRTNIVRALSAVGLQARLVQRRLKAIDPAVLPCLVFRRSGDPVVLVSLARNGQKAIIAELGDDGFETEISARKLSRQIGRDVLLVTPRGTATRSLDEKKPNRRTHWFWGPMRAQGSLWTQIGVAALCINLLGLALPIFVMNVYDRVIPNTAFVTLWTLATGVGIAIGLDLILRGVRGHILEHLGRQLDTSLASTLFAHVLSLRPQIRSSDAPHLASQIRDFETVREFFGSASFVAIIDMLFIGLFIWVLWIIVGPLALVPLLAVPLAMLLAFIAQLPMGRVARDAQDLSGQRHSVLTEAIVGHETIKTLNAEPVVQREWERVSAASARVNGRSRFWSTLATSGTQMIQQSVSVVIIVWGVLLVSTGQITVGALIAANILAGRAIAPIGAISHTIFRAQYARKALRSLSAIMAMPSEAGDDVVSAARVREGAVRCEGLSYRYPGSDHSAVAEVDLSIASGECIAVLGRVGSGKSTLGKLLSGLLEADKGSLLIDERGVRQYDPAELRAGIGYLPQDAQLFTGTIRENLIIGRPEATPEEIDAALSAAGMREIVEKDPAGLARHVGEKGANLSGGQRQGLSLARLLLRKPKLLFLDEPTNAMDQEMENSVAGHLQRLNQQGTGLILCTHRPALAQIADRWIVMDQGRIVLDGPRLTVQAQLQSGQPDQKAAE